MLFHITHQHSQETCPAHDADRMAATFGKMMAAIDESGVVLHGFYANAPAHRVYLVAEADNVEVLNKILYPAFTIGTAEIEPVVDAAAAAQAFEEEARK